MTQTEYMNAKTVLEEVQRLPVEAQRAVVAMVHGAVVVNDVYSAQARPAPPMLPPTSGPEGGPTPVGCPAP